MSSLRVAAGRIARLPGMRAPANLVRRAIGRPPVPRRDDKDGIYGASYFSGGRDGRTGYERYERDNSNSDFAAFLIWRHFDVVRTLEFGAAMGYLVESMRELGIEADGCDVSRYAVEHASPPARPHMSVIDLRGHVPVEDRSYDMAIALETFEHLEPEAVPAAITELARVTHAWAYLTIPSFGSNGDLPGGFFSGKVAWDRLEHYESLPDDYEGPVPYDDLLRDARGEPIEGHLTIASFAWWTARFAEAGMVRCPEMERRVHVDIEDLGFRHLWDTYVFCHPGTPLPPESLRSAEEVEAIRTRWRLEERRPQPRCG